MTDNSANAPMTDREEIELLLPWYATGKLSAAEQQRVADYLAENPDISRQLELIAEESNASIAANEALGSPSPGALDRMLARLDSEAAEPVASAAGGLLARLKRIFPGAGSPALQFAGIAAAAIICVQAAVITGLLTTGGSGNGYVTASGGDAASSGPRILVSFADKATAAEISALLGEFDAVIVNGPKAGGIYEIRLTASEDTRADFESLLARLRERKSIVRFVAPAE